MHLQNVYKLEIPLIKRIVREMPQGVTQPIECEIEGGLSVIAKYQKNRWGTRVLINEWVGAAILRAMNITSPEVGFCILSDDVIEDFLYECGANEDTDIGQENKGICFYSEYIKGNAFNSELVSVAKNKTVFENIMLFDCLVDNYDRHDGNIIVSSSREIYAIDNSHILNLKDNRDDSYSVKEALIDVSVLEKNDLYRQYLGIVPFSKSRWKKNVCNLKQLDLVQIIDDSASQLPNEWLSEETVRYLSILRTTLAFRFGRIDEIDKLVLEWVMSNGQSD